MTHPSHTNRCPHSGHCCAATACHAGSVSRHEAREVLERDGWWYAAAWQRRGPGGTMHRPAPGAEPRLERPPLWIERECVAASIGGDGTALLDVVLEECAAAGVVAIRGMREERELVVVAAGLSREGTIALDDRLRDRVTKGACVRVVRAVIQREWPR